MARLQAGAGGEIPETPKQGKHPAYQGNCTNTAGSGSEGRGRSGDGKRGEGSGTVTNVLVGTNAIAVDAATAAAKAKGYAVQALGNTLGGNARALAELLVAKAAAVPAGSGKVCLLGGGETTCIVRGSGKGGRNQEMVRCSSLSPPLSLSSIPLPPAIIMRGS